MIKIIQNTWYYDVEDEANDFYLMDSIRCFVCGGCLKSWYVAIINSLEKFLPENFEPLCCSCTVLKALAKKGLIPSNCKCSDCIQQIIFKLNEKRNDWDFICVYCEKKFCSFSDDEVFKIAQDYLRSLY